jgi:hypothetical protein
MSRSKRRKARLFYRTERMKKYRRAVYMIVGCGALSFLIIAEAMVYGCLPNETCSKAVFGL